MHDEPALYESKDSVPQVKETFPGSFHCWTSISAYISSTVALRRLKKSEGNGFFLGKGLKRTYVGDTIDNRRVGNICQDKVVRTDD